MADLRELLLAVRAKHGRLTPELVVKDATDPDHPLHQEFEWDDRVAAGKYRRVQARELIRSVRVSYAAADGRPTEIRAFQSVRRPTGFVYEPTDEVARDDIAAKVLLADMEREWHALRKRYDSFAEFWALVRSDVEVA